MSDEEQRTERAPETEATGAKGDKYVYITVDCGCRFQIVSGLPVLNAGVLAMPDTMDNVCENHRIRQEDAQAQREEEAAKPKPKIELVRADGTPMDGSGRTIVRRN